jgi:hypothetical protein
MTSTLTELIIGGSLASKEIGDGMGEMSKGAGAKLGPGPGLLPYRAPGLSPSPPRRAPHGWLPFACR